MYPHTTIYAPVYYDIYVVACYYVCSTIYMSAYYYLRMRSNTTICVLMLLYVYASSSQAETDVENLRFSVLFANFGPS